jgi:ubiquinone/menaquinone biosynthesis C-methylase UbiE
MFEKRSQMMKTKQAFEDSVITHLLFRFMAPVMESPLRHRFFDPVRTLKGAGLQSGQHVLEVGPGTGFFTIPAAELVGQEGRIYAIDLHPLAIEQVARKIQDAGLTNARLIMADALETGLASDCMDLVLLLGVIPSPTLPLSRLVPEMHRVLKPEGALAVWTGFPWWSSTCVAEGGLFAYMGRQNGVHSFRNCPPRAACKAPFTARSS